MGLNLQSAKNIRDLNSYFSLGDISRPLIRACVKEAPAILISFAWKVVKLERS